jgi:hypothetical protein
MSPSDRAFTQKLRDLEDSGTPAALFSTLSGLHCAGRVLIRALVVTSQEPVAELFRSRNVPSYPLVSVRERNDISVFELSHKSGEGGKVLRDSFYVLPLELPYAYLILTISGWPFWNRVLVPYVRKFYPKVVRLFLSQEELSRLLRNIRGSGDDTSVRILKISSCRRLAGKGSRRRFETDIRWTDRPLDTVFRQAAEENVWFKSVTFKLGRQVGASFDPLGVEASVSKYGSVFFNGSLQLFMRSTIMPMAEIASGKMKFFMGRDRRSIPDHSPRPVVIRFATEVFRSPEDSRRFVHAMGRMKQSSCSVFHGNPYVHLSLVDNLDGSSAQVWVLRPNEVTIVPQIKASAAALKRIVNHVFEEWSEGAITEPRY